MSSSDPNNPENFNNDIPANPEVGLPPGPPPPEPEYAAPPPPPSGGPVYGDQTVQTGYDPAAALANPSKDERNWAMFSHLSAVVVGIIGATVGLPILGFLGPLVIYLMKKDESPFIADQAREALNFNISVTIIMFVMLILSFTVILLILTIPGMIVVGLGALILCVVAAIKASNGEVYRYPFTLRLIN